MSLPQEFMDTVRSRLKHDGALRAAMLAEAASAFLSGDLGIGLQLIADIVQATTEVTRLAAGTGIEPDRINEILGLKGRPHADEIVKIFVYLQDDFGVRLAVQPAA